MREPMPSTMLPDIPYFGPVAAEQAQRRLQHIGDLIRAGDMATALQHLFAGKPYPEGVDGPTILPATKGDGGNEGPSPRKTDPKAIKPYRDNPDALADRDPEDVEAEFDHVLSGAGGWTKDTLRDGKRGSLL